MAMPRFEGGTSLTPLAVDEHVAAGYFLEPGDHAQKCRLPASGRSYEDDELAFLDVEIDAVNYVDGPVGLADIFQQQACHGTLPSVLRPGARKTRPRPAA
jgi:hypothetical protein